MGHERKVRMLLAKPGFDPHDRGVKILATVLRNAGIEVIYTGLYQTPDKIVTTAIQEDVDAIGLSILSGAHIELCRDLLELLHINQAGDIPVFCGGVIPDCDVVPLKHLGIREVFQPGATNDAILEAIRTVCRRPDEG